jgi:hypothetical protein
MINAPESRFAPHRRVTRLTADQRPDDPAEVEVLRNLRGDVLLHFSTFSGTEPFTARSQWTTTVAYAGGVWSPTSSETLDRGAAILTLTGVGEKEVG